MDTSREAVCFEHPAPEESGQSRGRLDHLEAWQDPGGIQNITADTQGAVIYPPPGKASAESRLRLTPQQRSRPEGTQEQSGDPRPGAGREGGQRRPPAAVSVARRRTPRARTRVSAPGLHRRLASWDPAPPGPSSAGLSVRPWEPGPAALGPDPRGGAGGRRGGATRRAQQHLAEAARGAAARVRECVRTARGRARRAGRRGACGRSGRTPAGGADAGGPAEEAEAPAEPGAGSGGTASGRAARGARGTRGGGAKAAKRGEPGRGPVGAQCRPARPHPRPRPRPRPPRRPGRGARPRE